jgi:hypothetical protein
MPIHFSPTLRTPGFIPHRLTFRPAAGLSIDDRETVLLWRFRPEWHHLTRNAGYASLSKAELARVRHHPNPGQARRYAVARAGLREILPGLAGCAASGVPLHEDGNGRPGLSYPAGCLSIATTWAGIWDYHI